VRSLLLLLFLSVPAQAETSVIEQYFPQFEGRPIRQLRIHGLLRSRESLVLWMLGAQEGAPFNARAWQTGIERLYKTDSIYDIHTRITEVGSEIKLDLSLEDKWTLFPYFDFQGGGGSISLSAGLFDTNLLGTFTNVYAGGGYLDGEYSYEFGASQKWFLQSTYSLGADVAKIVQPVTWQNPAGENLANFTWERKHELITLGKQNGERVYWELPIEAYKDSVKNPNARTQGVVHEGRAQWKITPTIHLGKISHSDYLEEGHELGLSAFGANPAQANLAYYGAQIAWKHVTFLPDTRNLAYFLRFSHMTAAPLAYQFRLGGFDSVRGFATNRIFGLDSARANFEYRATILKWKIPALDLGPVVLQGALFTDAGQSWNSAGIDLATGAPTQKSKLFLYSAGTGLRAIFLRFANALARIDVAKAVEPNEGFNVAFGVGQFF